ncbi:MAG: response regulator [Candidatus Hodarchaeales archaeon]
MKILVVDDDECFLDRMKTVLELDNQTITIATSGNEALNKVRQFKFDLILTDLKMPDLSGIELLIKAREMGNTSIFIVITGFGTIESAVDAIKAGAYDYLLKPFKFPELQEKIREVEQDLLLREKLKFSKIEESNVDNYDFKSIKGELEPPFLIISDQNPETLIKKLNLIEAIPIWLDSKKWSEAISQPNLDVLKSIIVDYVENNSKGTIITRNFIKIDFNKKSEI